MNIGPEQAAEINRRFRPRTGERSLILLGCDQCAPGRGLREVQEMSEGEDRRNGLLWRVAIVWAVCAVVTWGVLRWVG